MPRAELPVWLFVAYGGGHIRMLLPVAQLARQQKVAVPVILALTTAAAVALDEGFQPLGFADFLEPQDTAALAIGRELVAGLPTAPVDLRESAAYLGLSYADLAGRQGEQQAASLYTSMGRQCFEPVGVLERIINKLQPDLVVATNSPRAERAAIFAAGRLGIPSACVVDLFAVDEAAWIGRPGYANRVCVLNDAVRERLVAAGRDPREIVVTGNPAFDKLQLETTIRAGRALRQAQGWNGVQVVVWASQPEPASHPSVPARGGDPSLPGRIERALMRWVSTASDRVLVVRRHPSEPAPSEVTPEARIYGDGRQFDLHPLLHAADVVVTMNSTVGVEAHLAGLPVVQVLGSLFDDSVPLARFGMAVACTDPADLGVMLDDIVRRQPCQRALSQPSQAAQAVLDVLKDI
ncbi:MAG: hypothetical protein JWP47_1482 [Polaromonas sp.]|jgi:hypothetical protein|nr:hypothetical protein [Polaromonas sp.]